MTTIAACIFHDEVIFPQPGDIINKRYVMRRPRLLKMPYYTMKDAPDAIAYQNYSMPCRVATISRPVEFFCFDDFSPWDYKELKEIVRRTILGRRENSIRFKLHMLERIRRQRVHELSIAEGVLENFKREDSNGYLAAKGWTGFGVAAKTRKLQDEVTVAESNFYYACEQLERFKAEVLPMIWPVTQKKEMQRQGGTAQA